jgi:predicted O-methyltransferase YrrM
MQKSNFKNVFIQALKPGRFRVMLKKVHKRLVREKGLHSDIENVNWIKSHASDFREFASSLDAELWEETEVASGILKDNAEKALNNIGYKLGGGGVYPLLYFITRYTKPGCIVETGVAAGYSSASFLTAIKVNQKGRLYSSDFPYFRLPEPEKYIGILVDDSLKDAWELYIEGDEANIPVILGKADRIDLFHYDSDKSYSGRKRVMSMIEDSLDKNALILMDDIQDNSFFYDYVEEKNAGSWHIFEYQGKYVGMAGDLACSSAADIKQE